MASSSALGKSWLSIFSMTEYNKQFLGLPELAEILESRGLILDDKSRTISYLKRIGYYRLSGYLYPFRQCTVATSPEGKLIYTVHETFKTGVRFETALQLYNFDKKLRLLVLDAIERIEIALRVSIAMQLGPQDRWAHRKAEFMDKRFSEGLEDPTRCLSKCIERLDELTKRSREDFVIHHLQTHSCVPLPVWMAVELWDFGLLNSYLHGLTYKDRSAIARCYAIPREQLLMSWVATLSHIRNICAHHGRLWNRVLVTTPKKLRKGEIELLDNLASDAFSRERIYGTLCIIQYLLNYCSPTSIWASKLKQLLVEFPESEYISPSMMGFSPDWENDRIWRQSGRASRKTVASESA